MISPIPNRMIPEEEIYRNFQDHARFCKESLMVETEARELVPMILSPGQIDCGTPSPSSAEPESPPASFT